MRLKDKVALITGASNGMGAAEAQLFAEEGATVIAMDIDVEAGKALSEKISKSGNPVEFHECDVTNESGDEVRTGSNEPSVVCNEPVDSLRSTETISEGDIRCHPTSACSSVSSTDWAERAGATHVLSSMRNRTTQERTPRPMDTANRWRHWNTYDEIGDLSPKGSMK